MSGEFICKICEITCNGKSPFEQHLQSAKHIKKAQVTQSSLSSEGPISPTINAAASSSPIIPRSPSSTTNLKISEDSSTSQSSMTISPETMRILLEWNHSRGYKPYCDICQLPLHGDTNADHHFKSDNHMHNEKLAAWKTIHEDNLIYSCRVCWKIFNNENQMRNHFESDDAHTNMVQQKANLKKLIQIYETYEKLKQVRRESKEKQSLANDNLPNQFEQLNLIDGTEQKPKAKSSGIFSGDKLHEIMKKKVTKDDDD